MPRLWNDTIDAHRRAVTDATLDSAAALVAEYGLRAVTMTRIAERAGIGRATLYKYFPDVDTILLAWHERQVTSHLEQLASAADEAEGAGERLVAVLTAYAVISYRSRGSHGRPDAELVAFLHRDARIAPAQQRLRDMILDLVSEGSRSGDLRGDVAAEELASYCLHALNAASSLPSESAVHRLVVVTLAGLRPSS